MSKQDNRREFPIAAATLDAFRAVFGAETKLIYLEENGQVRGMKVEDRVRQDKTEGEAA